MRINKVVRIGIKDKMSVFCHIDFDGKRLRITGVEGPMKNGNCKGSAGQIYPVKVDKFANGWNQDMLDKFNEIWEKWHLNDFHAGCEHQRAEGWEKEFNWDEADKWLGKPCPVCGYRYGTAWHTVEVPSDVLGFLCSLPEADKQPAWV